MQNDASGIALSPTAAQDLAAISALHAAAFGPGRFARTAYRIREGARQLSPHCRVARDPAGRLVGAVTMTAITVGDAPGHWLLGPLAIHADVAKRSIGRSLVRAALASVAQAGSATAVVLLVGDLKYYEPLGFAPVPPGLIRLPGPVDPARLLCWRGPAQDRELPAGIVRRQDD